MGYPSNGGYFKHFIERHQKNPAKQGFVTNLQMVISDNNLVTGNG
jgi:hypothetical protein